MPLSIFRLILTCKAIVADQRSKRALVFELVAPPPPLEQILSVSKHLGLVPEDPYIDVLCVRKSFCSGLGATETHRPTDPPLRL